MSTQTFIMTTHPKLETMLRDAMLHLKEHRGATLVQIRKHLEHKNQIGTKLDCRNKKCLTNALRDMVKSGEVSRNGFMYMLKEQQVAPEAEAKATVPHRVPGGKYCKSHSKYHKAFRRHHRRRRHHKKRKGKRHHRRRRHHRRQRHRKNKNHKLGHHHKRRCKHHRGRRVHCHNRKRMVFPLRTSSKKRY